MKRFNLQPTVILFVLLSVSDLVMTWWLLQESGRVTAESNPIADWWLSRYGWLGLAGFKMSLVLVVIGLTRIISRQRPRAAGHVLCFGCAILGLVLLYSAALGQTAPTPAELVAEICKEREEDNCQAQQICVQSIAYVKLLDSVCHDVDAGKCTLVEAVERLMRSEQNQDPARQRVLLSVLPGRCVEECLAIQIVMFVRESSVSLSSAPRLEEQYEAAFGSRAVRENKVAFAESAI
jgi:Domain of unknown function (DUF5658)